MARITIFGAKGTQEHSLPPHTTVGRHPSNTLQVLDRIVSKEHCHIDWQDGHYTITDLASLNGTFINGERINRHTLRDGDVITLGNTKLVFDAELQHLQTIVDAPLETPSHQGAQLGSQPGHTPPSLQVSDTHVESHIQTTITATHTRNFLPSAAIQDVGTLQRDYDKLRASHQLMQAIGAELDVDVILHRILDCAFQMLPADRGAVMLYNEQHQLKIRCSRTRRRSQQEALVLSSTIIDTVLRDRAAVLSQDASVDSRFQEANSVIMQGIRSTMAVPLIYGETVFGLMVIDSQVNTNAFTDKDLQLFQTMAHQASVAIQNSLFARRLEQEAVTREGLRRLVSPAIAEQIIEGKVDVVKGGQLREAAVLFADIRNFTSMSENKSPQAVVEMLNDYFERMVDVVFRHEGTLDKFLGDGMMVVFGAPIAQHNPATRAVKAAMDMMNALDTWNQQRCERDEEQIDIGIGISMGEVVAGYVGSTQTLDYTVIGDVVNIGARLCDAAKSGEILISQSTAQSLDGDLPCVALPPLQIKGKSRAIPLYRVDYPHYASPLSAHELSRI